MKTLKTKWGMKHPFHIHGTQFKVVSVDGKAPPKDMKGKKTLYLWNLVKSQNRSCFKNTGIFMFHCHILEHEDSGMMGQVKVTK